MLATKTIMPNVKQVICIAFLTTLAAVGHAEDSPSSAINQYFAFLEHQHWKEAAELFDPEALSDFRSTMSFISGLPEKDRAGIYGNLFGPGVDEATVLKFTNAEFFGGILKLAMKPAISTGASFTNLVILGGVPEGENVRHVVIRHKGKVAGVEIEMTEVISCKKTQNGWRLIPNGNIKGLAAIIEQGFKKSAVGKQSP